jgi:hypothetical protein
MSTLKLLLASALSVALVVPGHAASKVPSTPAVHGVTFAQWHRGGWGWRHGGGWGWGAWPWIGLGFVAGAIIADEAYRPHPGHYYDESPYNGPYYYPSDYRGDPREICLQNFRTFQWRTGYYTTYSGERRLCPYLREAALAPDTDKRLGPYGAPQAPSPNTARPPSATLHSAAPPQSLDPDADTGRPPPYKDAASPPQSAAPSVPGDDDDGTSPPGPEEPSPPQ